jgi:tetratricopeptide (TPR) repeat protein
VLAQKVSQSQKAFVSLMCAIIAIFSTWTYQRNLLWQDNITFLKDCVSKAPESIRPRFNLATELQLKGQLEDARLHLEKILAKNPYYLTAYTSLANIWVAQNNIEKAIETYLEGLSLDPDKVIGKPRASASAYFNVGSILLNRRMLDEAIYFLETGLAIDPDNADAYVLAGQARMRRGDDSVAASHFWNALRLNPDDQMSSSFLEQLAYQQPHVSENRNDLTTPNGLYPENITIHLLLGDFSFRKKDHVFACTQYDKILKMDPEHAGARAGWAKCGEI